MKYRDRVYNEIEIHEPIILDLINCPSLQRLKYIDQAGYLEPFFPGTAQSRFEHSIGVYYLLKIYNAPLEEQIAGLIHDVSHSIFSHCIDYVLDVGSETDHSHQDNVFDEFVRNSEIPEIIKKYNLDLDYILDDKNFPLKEKSLPDLCADRIDYSLRTAIVFKDIENAKYFLDNLIVENKNWIFKNFESAKKFAELFYKLNTEYFAGLSSAIMFRTVGDCLRFALAKGYISENDLYTTDEQVIQKIKSHLDQDFDLKLLFDRMNNKTKIENNPDDYKKKVFCKSRIIDPFCYDHEKIKKVSELDSEWKKILIQESQPKEYFLKFDK